MNVKFYHNYSDNIVVDKNITQIGNTISSAVIKDNVSVTDPVFILKDFTNFNPATANYCYIDSLNRYYYITDIIILTNSVYEIHCRVDVLKTYASGIRGNTAVIGRQQQKSAYNLLLRDGTYKVKANPNYQIFRLPSGFSGHYHILLVAGTAAS